MTTWKSTRRSPTKWEFHTRIAAWSKRIFQLKQHLKKKYFLNFSNENHKENIPGRTSFMTLLYWWTVSDLHPEKGAQGLFECTGTIGHSMLGERSTHCLITSKSFAPEAFQEMRSEIWLLFLMRLPGSNKWLRWQNASCIPTWKQYIFHLTLCVWRQWCLK